MQTRSQIAEETARALMENSVRLRENAASSHRAVLGFDGFVDDITEVVAQRQSADRYERMTSMTQLAHVLSSTAGHGCNVELVVKKQKLGGNGPIMGFALATLGVNVTYIGAVGNGPPPAVHPVFEEFAARAMVIPITDAARTQALEFSDGKLMMGQLAPLAEITSQRLIERVGLDKLISYYEQSSLIGLLNWNMLPHATALWKFLGESIFPKLSSRPRRVFVDMADPKKRPADLPAALAVLSAINRMIPVTLGLNHSEAAQVATALKLSSSAPVVQLAADIRDTLALDTVVVHPSQGAAAAMHDTSAEFAGPFIKEPAILTGGGDHFNTGFALGQMLELPLQNILCLATATSGYYVRHAASPAAAQLAEFLLNLPDPQR